MQKLLLIIFKIFYKLKKIRLICCFLIYLDQVYENSFTLAKRLSKKQKEEIIKLFTIGKTIEELSLEFDCTKLTISRNLKKNLSEQKFKELITKEKLKNLDYKGAIKALRRAEKYISN